MDNTVSGRAQVVSQQFGDIRAEGNSNVFNQGIFYGLPDSGTNNQSNLFVVPRSAHRLFTGRQDTLQTLSRLLVGGDQEQSEQLRIVVTGLGGVGKSELCLRLIDIVRKSFEHILWIDVSDHQNAEREYISIARQLGLTAGSLSDAVQGLSSLRQTWLLILDNADDPERDYHCYFPPGNRGKVIMTSRNPDCGRVYGRTHWEQLEVLDDLLATNLLLRAASIAPSPPSLAQASKIAETLGGHTLAILLAGSYVARGSCNLEQYLSVFEKKWQRLLMHSTKQDRSRYGSVLATFEASISILERESDESASDAFDLLHVLSTLAANNVPFVLFEKARSSVSCIVGNPEPGDVETLSNWHVSKLPAFLEAFGHEWDPYRTTEACNTLEALALVTISGSGAKRTLSMHPLIHDWVWRRQTQQQMDVSWTVAGSVLSASLYDRKASREHLEYCRQHLGSCVSKWQKYKLVPKPDFPIFQILYQFAYVLDKIRDDHLALTCLDVISRTWFESDGAGEIKNVGFNKLWARCRLRNGDAAGSIALSEQVLSAQDSLPEDNPNRLASQHALANAYQANGQVQQAVTLLEHIVSIEGNLANATRLASQHALASAYHANGQVEEAVDLLEQFIEANRGNLDENHPSQLVLQHALASAYQANGKAKKAIPLLEHVVKVEASCLAKDHPSRLASQYALASAYEADDRVQEAIILLEHVVRIRQASLAEDHPSRLTSQYALASAYEADGQVKEAVTLLEHVVKVRASSLAEGHPDQLKSQHALAGAYSADGQVKKAIDLLEHVVRVEETLPGDRESRLTSQYALASAYEANGQTEELIALLERIFNVEANGSAVNSPVELVPHTLPGAQGVDA